MKLSLTEKNDFFERFKNRDEDKLMVLSLQLKSDRKYEKAEIIDLILDIKRQDINGLKQLQKKFKKNEQWQELDFVNSVLEHKQKEAALEVKELEKKAKIKNPKKEKKKPEFKKPSLGLSEEVAKAMKDRIVQDAKKHRYIP